MCFHAVCRGNLEYEGFKIGFETLFGLYHALAGSNGDISKIKGLCYYKSGNYTENESAALIDVTTLPMVDYNKLTPAR